MKYAVVILLLAAVLTLTACNTPAPATGSANLASVANTTTLDPDPSNQPFSSSHQDDQTDSASSTNAEHEPASPPDQIVPPDAVPQRQPQHQYQPSTSTLTTNELPTVHASATGVVQAEPDTAIITMAVQTEHETVEPARARAARVTNELIQTLHDHQIDEKDIATANFSIYPRYDYSDGNRLLMGYTVAHSLKVKVRDIDNAGHVIDAASQSGGSNLEFHHITFDIDDPTDHITLARAQAVDNLHRIAAQLAEESDRELGPLLSIREGFSFTPTAPFTRSYDFLESAGTSMHNTSIAAGQTTVSVSVSGVFELQ